MLENNFIEITSLNNELVKDVAKLQQKKYRTQSGLLLLEGEKSVFGALEENIGIKYIFFCDENMLKEFPKNENVKFCKVNEKVMAKLSTTKSPTNILAVAFALEYDLNSVLKKDRLVLIDSIKDAGNLGTIIRSACALNMDAILLFGECCDEFSSKVIRSSAGNIFKIPVIQLGMDTCVLEKLKKSHKIISTVAPFGIWGKKAKLCDEITYPKSFILALGSEASGLCDKILNFSDIYVTLKTVNQVESLNISVFAGIIFYIINSKK